MITWEQFANHVDNKAMDRRDERARQGTHAVRDRVYDPAVKAFVKLVPSQVRVVDRPAEGRRVPLSASQVAERKFWYGVLKSRIGKWTPAMRAQAKRLCISPEDFAVLDAPVMERPVLATGRPTRDTGFRFKRSA